jgi:hypothetical protein
VIAFRASAKTEVRTIEKVGPKPSEGTQKSILIVHMNLLKNVKADKAAPPSKSHTQHSTSTQSGCFETASILSRGFGPIEFERGAKSIHNTRMMSLKAGGRLARIKSSLSRFLSFQSREFVGLDSLSTFMRRKSFVAGHVTTWLSLRDSIRVLSNFSAFRTSEMKWCLAEEAPYSCDLHCVHSSVKSFELGKCLLRIPFQIRWPDTRRSRTRTSKRSLRSAPGPVPLLK